MGQIDDYIRQNKERFLEELKTLLTIPSVSANDLNKQEMMHCAERVRDLLAAAGCDTAEVCITSGWPLVFGEKTIDKSKPVVLVYGHYDVQPPDPMILWHSGPFDPVVRDGKIFARGASDDKGQMFIHIKALEAMVKTGNLPCNVRFIIEGEEETGSPSLEGFLKKNKERLSADVVLASDTSMISLDCPSIEIALRGMAYMQVEVTRPDHDLHSGTYGGAVANPITVLCQMIDSLHDKNNRIAIPGFYDKVTEFSKKKREQINKIPFNLKTYKKELGVKEVYGEEGYTTLERVGIRPSLDVNGIWGGYIGKGGKTVLPSKAYAKISMRLVPNQRSGEIAALFSNHLKNIAPPTVKVKTTYMHGGEAAITSTDSKAYRAAAKAIQQTFGKEPVPVYSGGSIPIVSMFKKMLGVDTVLLGFGLDNNNIHSPNEKLDLANFYKGIETVPYFYQYFAEESIFQL
jgi:acetylornithine deacetylase/succinyl-diaminopimelate desuccinylase-like protein